MAEISVPPAPPSPVPPLPVVPKRDTHVYRTIAIVASLVIAAVVVVIVFWSAFAGKPAQPAVTPAAPEAVAPTVSVGLLLPGIQEARWVSERDVMAAEAERLGVNLVSASADLNADLQESQARNLIMQGVKALIVIPQDAVRAAAIVDAAHQAGIKVIAYDRLIKNSNLDYYLSFDNVKVGVAEAQGVLDVVSKGRFAYIGGSPTDNNATLVRQGSFQLLQPKIDSGDIKIVLDKQIDSWDPSLAYKAMDEFLNKGGKLDAAVVANDGMAGGVIQALKEHGLAGKVPVSGQDAEIAALRNIIAGTQAVTVYKPVKNLAIEAVRMALALAKGDAVDAPMSTNNGQIEVPSRLLDVVAVTKANLEETVIKDGFHTAADIYGTQQQ